MLIRPRRARPIHIKSSARDKGSMMRMLQGIVVIGFGIIFIIANANTGSSPYQEISGHIQKLYEKTINGQYNSNFLNISTAPQDLFIFDKNALQPAWNGQFYLGQEIDIHYLDKNPKTVVAFQLYDQYGHALTLYTTPGYQPQPVSAPTNVGFIIGVVLTIIGIVTLAFVLYHNINIRRRKSSDQSPQSNSLVY